MKDTKKFSNLKTIFRFLKPHLFLTLLAPLCVLLEVWAELEQPGLMAQIVDDGILGNNPDCIKPLGIKMVVILLIGVAGGIMSIYAAGKVSYHFGAAMRKTMFEKIQHFSFYNIDKLQVGSLITRMGDDITRVQGVVQASMRLLFRAPFMFVGAVFMVLTLNINLSIVLLFLMAASMCVVVFIMKKTLPLFINQQKQRDSFTSLVQEILTGVRVTKAYVREDHEKQRFEQANNQLKESTLHVSRIMSAMMPVVSFALNAGIIAVIYIGASEIQRGTMQIGGIMASINYLAQIQMALMMASHVIMSISQAEASMNRINEVLDTPIETGLDNGEDFANGDLEFKNVSFGYKDALKENDKLTLQLENINFSIHQGGTLAIMGETGAGKSTLVNLIPRFYDVDSGTISIGGKDIKNINRTQLQKHVGIVLQHTLLFSGTIADNLKIGNDNATDDEMMQICRQVQMEDYVNSFPEKLNHRIEQEAVNLSGGQKQRFSIARALLAKPDILILDDSFCALDLLTESKVKSALKNLSCTKIIIAQRISSIVNADKILLLGAGKVIDCGSHNELMQRCELYKEIYQSQTGKEETL